MTVDLGLSTVCPPAKPGVFHRRVKPWNTSARVTSRWYGLPVAKDCYLPPVNGLFRYFPSSTVRSNYFYQQAVMNKPDNDLPFRGQITSVFRENRGVYGYFQIHLALKRKGITLSEKGIRHIMKEEGLAAFVPKRVKYSSYLGEITPEVDNIISRDFHAKQPYEKLLTDIRSLRFPMASHISAQ